MGTTPYGSDSLWSYELGTKNTWVDGKINTRLAAYRINWNQIQQSILLACSFHVTENVGSAVSKGGELEVDGAPFSKSVLQHGIGVRGCGIHRGAAGLASSRGLSAQRRAAMDRLVARRLFLSRVLREGFRACPVQLHGSRA